MAWAVCGNLDSLSRRWPVWRWAICLSAAAKYLFLASGTNCQLLRPYLRLPKVSTLTTKVRASKGSSDQSGFSESCFVPSIKASV